MHGSLSYATAYSSSSSPPQDDGWTALHYASCYGYTGIVRELIAVDGSVEHLRMQDNLGRGSTALDKTRNEEIKALLTAAEAAADAGAVAPPPEGKAREGDEGNEEEDSPPPPSQGGAVAGEAVTGGGGDRVPAGAAEGEGDDTHRLVSASSADPFERGVALGNALGPLAVELHGLLAGVWFGHLADEWAEIAGASLAMLEEFAPVTAQEIKGYASVLGGDGMRVLLMLGSEREIGMLNAQRAAGLRSPPLGGTNDNGDGPDDCSGLIWASPSRSVLGHATDLTPEFYLSGRATRVCRLAAGVHADSGESYPACLCINFAGIGCIGGSNADGLTISRFTVDTGERNLDAGVPVYWLVREALTRRTLEAAIDYLRECPRTLPYAFHLAQGGRAVGVECSPSQFTVKPAERDGDSNDGVYRGARANHCVLDAEMIRTEIGAHHLAALGGQHDKSSVARQAALERALEKLTGDGASTPDIAGVQAALRASPVTNETTMFCFAAESCERKGEGGEEEEDEEAKGQNSRQEKPHSLHVQFFGDGPTFHAYSV